MFHFEMKNVRSSAQQKRISEGIGFRSKCHVPPEVVRFMHLDDLKCGELVSPAFMIKFFGLYCKLGGMIDKGYINMSPVLCELFREELKTTGIDPFAVKYTEFIKLLGIKRGSNFMSPVQIAFQKPGVIGRPGNIADLELKIDEIRKTLNEGKKEPGYDQLILDMRTVWICLGLPGWNGMKALKIKVYGGDEDPECCVCMEKQKNQIFMPCKHMCCCSDCASSVIRVQKKCPICRQAIINLQAFDELKHEI
jgi:hypothetical protein